MRVGDTIRIIVKESECESLMCFFYGTILNPSLMLERTLISFGNLTLSKFDYFIRDGKKKPHSKW